MRYRLTITYNDGAIASVPCFSDEHLVTEIQERIADNNKYRHVRDWSIHPRA